MQSRQIQVLTRTRTGDSSCTIRRGVREDAHVHIHPAGDQARMWEDQDGLSLRRTASEHFSIATYTCHDPSYFILLLHLFDTFSRGKELPQRQPSHDV